MSFESRVVSGVTPDRVTLDSLTEVVISYTTLNFDLERSVVTAPVVVDTVNGVNVIEKRDYPTKYYAGMVVVAENTRLSPALQIVEDSILSDELARLMRVKLSAIAATQTSNLKPQTSEPEVHRG